MVHRNLRFFVYRRNSCGRGNWLPGFLHVQLLIGQQTLGRFSSNLAHVCSSPGKFFLNMVA